MCICAVPLQMVGTVHWVPLEQSAVLRPVGQAGCSRTHVSLLEGPGTFTCMCPGPCLHVCAQACVMGARPFSDHPLTHASACLPW